MRKSGPPHTDLLVYQEGPGKLAVQAATGRAIHMLHEAKLDLVDQTVAVLAEGPFELLMERADELGLTSLTLG